MDDPELDQWKKFAEYLNKVSTDKQKMVDRGLTQARATCPKCGVLNAMTIRLTPQRRDRTGFHARWACKTEGCGFSGME